MIGIRLIGEPDEVAEAARILGDAFRVIAESRPYPCRGADIRVRLYIDAELTPTPKEDRP
ncbi:hypothetical protein AB0M95_27610 [Sphaerisporangium sp. NPDC051017]|uniref:hypothetical protein n=1 Tax=Sphaerisporangium sp. NPDC051017 TaxID=3154636 RepID=UPI00342F6956